MTRKEIVKVQEREIEYEYDVFDSIDAAKSKLGESDLLTMINDAVKFKAKALTYSRNMIRKH